MTERVNVFLDTTMTYQDPFFKNNFNRNLLKLAELDEISLFMSQVVFEETRNKFEENVHSRMQALDQALNKLNNFYPDELNTETIQRTLENFITKFDEFYNDLFEKQIIQIVEFDNNILPTLVERSIKQVKPFGPKKQEFRDAITWLSYATIAEEETMENCFFITENINDFCQGKGNIHPSLLEDSRRFKHYVSAKDLLENEATLKSIIRTAEVVEWVSNEVIDEKYILGIMNQKDLFDNIFSILGNLINDYDIDRFVEGAYETGYADLWLMDIDEVTESSIEVIGDEILISGKALVEPQLEVYFYNPLRESRHDEEYLHAGGDTVTLEINFTFSYNTDKKVDHFEVTNFRVLEKMDLGLDSYYGYDEC